MARADGISPCDSKLFCHTLTTALIGVPFLHIDYRIFEYARSEFDARGVLILIALHIQLSNAHRVIGYLKSDWQKEINSREDFDRKFLEDFFYDVEQMQFKQAYELRQFLEETEELSIGPLRTYASGVCSLSQLSDPTRHLLDHSLGVDSCSDEIFSRLTSELLEQIPQDINPLYGPNYKRPPVD